MRCSRVTSGWVNEVATVAPPADLISEKLQSFVTREPRYVQTFDKGKVCLIFHLEYDPTFSRLFWANAQFPCPINNQSPEVNEFRCKTKLSEAVRSHARDGGTERLSLTRVKYVYTLAYCTSFPLANLIGLQCWYILNSVATKRHKRETEGEKRLIVNEMWLSDSLNRVYPNVCTVTLAKHVYANST